MHHPVRKLLPVLAALAIVVAPGCTDQEVPTGMTPATPESASFSSTADLSRLATFNSKPTITIAWAKKWIGPEGGRLDFQGFAIDVPAGAVDKVTQFSIQLPVDPNGSDKVVAEFGPHNSKFAKPVTIEFPYAGTSIQGSRTAKVVWWNDAWVDMGGAVTADGTRIKTQTDHFSTYGTTDDDGGGILVSGG